MTYRITINDLNYTTWSIEPHLDNIDPITLKLFNDDTIDEKYNIINSPIRNTNILGILILNNFQSYGKM